MHLEWFNFLKIPFMWNFTETWFLSQIRYTYIISWSWYSRKLLQMLPYLTLSLLFSSKCSSEEVLSESNHRKTSLKIIQLSQQKEVNFGCARSSHQPLPPFFSSGKLQSFYPWCFKTCRASGNQQLQIWPPVSHNEEGAECWWHHGT